MSALPPGALLAFVREAPVSLILTGRSMTPHLEPGARVVVSRVTLPLPGDVVVFPLGGRLVVHRALAVFPWRGSLRLLAKGDAAPGADPLVPFADVVGRVEERVALRHRVGALGDLVRAVRSWLLSP